LQREFAVRLQYGPTGRQGARRKWLDKLSGKNAPPRPRIASQRAAGTKYASGASEERFPEEFGPAAALRRQRQTIVVPASAQFGARAARANVVKATAGNTQVQARCASFASLIEEASQMTTKRLLTEAEILKMSDKDYMNEDQLAFFKNRLEQLQAEILRNAGQTTENLRETVIVPDPADRATIEEEHALELRTRDRERKLLKKVQQSLARIDSGDYGWCEETGEPIGIPRMLARPTATLSLEAQERRELRQKLFGD
jgi:DnaK suppressor protein